MLTKREAYQRCSLHRMNLRLIGTDWTISPMEGGKKIKPYTSDDLEDVVLMAGRLRNQA